MVERVAEKQFLGLADSAFAVAVELDQVGFLARTELGLLAAQTVPCSARGLFPPGAVAVRAGQSVVEVDPFGVHAQRDEGVLLGGEVLIHGRDPADSSAVSACLIASSAVWSALGYFRHRWVSRERVSVVAA